MPSLSDTAFPASTACPPDMLDVGVLAVFMDDDPAQRMALAMLAEVWGYRALAGAAPKDVLPDVQAASCTPGIIIVDFRLSQDLTAYDAVAECNAALNCAPPVIVVTGDTSQELRENVQRCGWRILHKPFSPHALQALMAEMVLERHGAQA